MNYGNTKFSQRVVENLLELETLTLLSNREREVLRLIAEGNSNKQISKELYIAEVTVRFHIRNIYDKIGVRTRAQAIRWAIKHGLGTDLMQ